ncbi:F0F1 ATP synthase subunit B, partial [Candidatus Saccharibacteria bacterium]|nr:F0F1 ATP synthase subunit B [Candidatus Saccharibacteria bacterium]
PVTPGAGGGGGGGGGAGSALPEELPNTGVMDLIPLAFGTIATSMIAVVLSRLGLAAYRRQSSK